MPDDEGLDSIELCEVYRKLPWTPLIITRIAQVLEKKRMVSAIHLRLRR